MRQYIKSSILALFFILICSLLNESKAQDNPKITEYKKLIEQHKASGNKAQQAKYLNMLADIHWNAKNEKKAIDCFIESLELNKSIGNKNAITVISSNIGMLYTDINQYSKALTYFQTALDFSKKSNNKPYIMSNLLKIVDVYQSMKQHNKAIDATDKALNLAKELNNTTVIRNCYAKLAESYKQVGDTDKSFEYLNLYTTFDKHIVKKQADEIAQESQRIANQANARANETEKELDSTHTILKKTKDTLVKNQELTKEQQIQYEVAIHKKQIELESAARVRNIFIGAFVIITLLAFSLFRLYRQKQTANKLLAEQKIELEKLSIVARETDNAIIIMDAKGNFEWVNSGFTRIFGYTLEDLISKKGGNIIKSTSKEHIKNKIIECINEKKPIRYQFETTTIADQKLHIQANVTPALNRAGEIVKLIAIDSDITKIKEAELKILAQKNILEKQNEQIKNSILYAETIQSSIFPLKANMDKVFESFLVFRPKDIVSGDFYWYHFEKSDNKYDDKIFIAAVDCTGHGVPGAFMSMIGSRLLSEIVAEKRIHDPATILKNMHSGIIEILKQDQTFNDDGMDVCLCSLQRTVNTEEGGNDKMKVTFSGAKRPLFCYEKNKNELSVIKGSRKPIGGKHYEDVEYTTEEILLNNGDVIYLTSDGIVDQISPKKKKFSTTSLINLLKLTGNLPLVEQKTKIENTLDDFQQDTLQRDDITIFGVKMTV